MIAMHVYSVRYSFKQSLTLPAKEAFEWCTDYKPYDLTLMNETGKRRIRKLTHDAILLTETTRRNKKTVTKTKLVRLNKPQLSWTNVHITGPNRHSEFLYKIEPLGKNRSRLNFTGLLIYYSRRALTRRTLRKIARDERRADSQAWRYLSTAMWKDARPDR
jgi:hypothetical protein